MSASASPVSAAWAGARVTALLQLPHIALHRMKMIQMFTPSDVYFPSPHTWGREPRSPPWCSWIWCEDPGSTGRCTTPLGSPGSSNLGHVCQCGTCTMCTVYYTWIPGIPGQKGVTWPGLPATCSVHRGWSVQVPSSWKMERALLLIFSDLAWPDRRARCSSPGRTPPDTRPRGKTRSSSRGSLPHVNCCHSNHK